MGRPKRTAKRADEVMGTRAVMYLRVSGEGQLKEGYGLDAQQDACVEYAVRKGYSIVATLRDEAISGVKDMSQRPALTQAVGMCVTGQADVFLCYALDRQSRDVILFNTVRSQLKKAGIRFETAKEGQDFTRDESMLMGDIYAAFAAEERRRISMRLLGGRGQRSKIDGLGSGPLPYGYMRATTGEITINPDEQKVIAIILTSRDAGIPYRAISERLNKEHYRTAKGTPWTPGSVETISRHETLYRTGVKKWGKVEAYQQWPILLAEVVS